MLLWNVLNKCLLLTNNFYYLSPTALLLKNYESSTILELLKWTGSEKTETKVDNPGQLSWLCFLLNSPNQWDSTRSKTALLNNSQDITMLSTPFFSRSQNIASYIDSEDNSTLSQLKIGHCCAWNKNSDFYLILCDSKYVVGINLSP